MSVLARWISTDPEKTLGGLNTYLYADANSIRLMDSSGLQAEEGRLWKGFEKPGGYREDWSEYEFWERGKLYRSSAPGQLTTASFIGSGYGGGRVWWEALRWRVDGGDATKEEVPFSAPPLVEAAPPEPHRAPKKPITTEIDFDDDTIIVEKKGPTPDEVRIEIMETERKIRQLAPELKKALEEAKSETIGAIPGAGFALAAAYDFFFRDDTAGAAKNLAEEGTMHYGEKVGETVFNTDFGKVPVLGSAIDTFKMGRALDIAGNKAEKMEALRLRRYRLKDQLGDPDARYDDPNDPKAYLGPSGLRYDKRTGKPVPDIQGRRR